MLVWVTGAAGFVGRHAIKELRKGGHEVVASVAPGESTSLDLSSATEGIDLSDAAGLASFARNHKPDACLHLAGMAFVPKAWECPQDAFRVNTIGTLNLLEAFRAHRPEARFLTVTSAQIYGHVPQGQPIGEETPPVAESIYAVSKWSADASTLLYAARHGMNTMTARPCNHIGPGQSESFVVSAFARQLIEIREGIRPNAIKVGNLASRREFTDVRDVVRAYRLILEKGHAGLAYNVASGNLTTIQAVFDALCLIVGVSPKVEIDPSLYRPTDTQPEIDISRLKSHTGWAAQLSMDTTLRDIVEDFSGRVTGKR